MPARDKRGKAAGPSKPKARLKLIVVAPLGTDVEGCLSSLVSRGRLSSFSPDGRGSMLRSASDASRPSEPVASVALGDLSVSPASYDEAALRRFWRGAVEHDGSISDALLSVMRFDDGERERYRDLYIDEDGYVDLRSRPWADAALVLPAGEWSDWLSLRNPTRRREWVTSFAGRFLSPGDADDLMASAWEFSR